MNEPKQHQFEITHQHVATEPDGQGGFSEHYKVHFKTPSGTHSHIKVKREHYTARNVHNLVSTEAHLIEQVHALDGLTVPEHETEPPA